MEEDEDAAEPAIVKHARRLSTTGWPPSGPASRFGGGGVGATNANTGPPPTAEQQERGAGIFRRLSLGGALARVRLPSPKLFLIFCCFGINKLLIYLSFSFLAPGPHPSIRTGQAAHGERPAARGLSPRHVALRRRRRVPSAQDAPRDHGGIGRRPAEARTEPHGRTDSQGPFRRLQLTGLEALNTRILDLTSLLFLF